MPEVKTNPIISEGPMEERAEGGRGAGGGAGGAGGGVGGVQGEVCYGFNASEVPQRLVVEEAGGVRVRRERRGRPLGSCTRPPDTMPLLTSKRRHTSSPASTPPPQPLMFCQVSRI